MRVLEGLEMFLPLCSCDQHIRVADALNRHLTTTDGGGWNGYPVTYTYVNNDALQHTSGVQTFKSNLNTTAWEGLPPFVKSLRPREAARAASRTPQPP